jgi:hypothetical protein
MSTAISVNNGVNSQGLRYGTVIGSFSAAIVSTTIITIQIVASFLVPPVPLKCHELMDDDFTAQLVTASPNANHTLMASVWKPSLDKSSPVTLNTGPRREVP